MKLLVFCCFTTHHPSWRKRLNAATITPQIFVRCWWKLQHALVPGKKPCCYQKEWSLGLRIQRCCSPVVGASVNSIFCWQIFCKTVVQHLGLCVVLFWFQDIQQFGEMLHGFKHLGKCCRKSCFFCLRLRSDFCFHPEVIPVLLSRCLETNDRVWSFNCKLHKLSHESRRNITSFLFQLCRCSSLVSLYFEGIHLKICLDAPSSSMKHVMSFWWSRLLSAGALRSKSFYILILTTSENGYWNIKLFSHWLGAKIIESFIILLVSWNEWPIAKSPL